MKKRIGAALLSFAMLAALFVPSVIPARAEADNAITPVLTTTEAKKFAVRDRKDAIITDVQLLQSEKETLTVSGGTVSGSIQWQIRVQGGVWANISGANDTSLEVSYALVANLLNGGTAALRCKRTDEDGKTETTPAVTVRIRTEAQPAKAAPALGTVLAGAKPLGEAVISQANAPTAQPEKTAQPSAAPMETPASSPAAETAASSAPAQTNAPAETKAPALVKAAAPILQAKPVAETQTAAPTAEAKPAAETQTAAPTAEAKSAAETQTAAPAAEAKPAAETQTAAPTAEAKSTADTKGSTESDPAPANDPTESNTTAPSPATYTILINYIFADGKQAAPSWSATVATGSTYTQDIQSPVVVGYTPSETVVHVNTSEAKIYTVTYQPAEVEFTVKHYQQNVSNDEYTLADTETKKGFTESAVGAGLAKTDYTGFYSLLYDTTTTIAADGSTVVEIYYDRYYYLMNFDLDGGYGVEPIYARYGAPISVDTPTKPGYTFVSWTPSIPSTMPDDNTSYKASWKIGESGFTVVFWYENANDNGYSVAGTYKPADVKPGTEKKSVDYKNQNFTGRDTKHFTYNAAKAETVTVKGDGSTVLNVYYTRNTYTLKFRVLDCDKWLFHEHSDKCYKDIKTIKAKYQADIHSNFPIKDGDETIWWIVPDGTETYGKQSSDNPHYLGSIDTMPGENITFKANGSESGAKIYYYVETINGAAGDTTYGGRNYKQYKVIDLGYSGSTSLTYREEFHPITGFTQGDSNPYLPKNGSVRMKKNNYLYYTRNSYNLKFYNYNAYVDGKGGSVQYEAPLSSYYFEPEYPANLEKNAFVFDGWYTTAGCYEGSKADLSTMTMPASDVILYAKWAPKTHTVKAYQTKDALEKGGDALHTYDNVPHGTTVTPTPADPKRDPYKFVGWFYISDTGEEKAYNFSMPVNRDLNLYAKWSSKTLMNFEVRYELEDGKEIALPFTGSALAGSTKTFNAKTGTQLNERYQSGYFPKVSSHSITIDIADASKNKYTFVYVAKEKVEYTVKYLEKGTGNQLAEPKTVTTHDAVVTETFKQIPGYAPDAYQKQLVLAAEDNKIVFWYVKDDAHAPVHIIHWTQNIEGEGYTERQSSTNLNGVIGTEYSETPLTIAGFTYNGTKSNASGELTAAGLVLNLYYDRIEYPYEFRFLEQGTDKELADSVTGNARYQTQVTQTAKTIPGYTLVSAENQAIHIAIEDPATVASKNVKTFYYTEQVVDIKYEVVGPDGCGTLDNYQDVQLKVTSGEVKGSAPTTADGFKFVGWYKDEECTQPVDAAWVANSKLTPDKTKNYGTDAAPVMGYEAATYYAKFEYDVADLTITKRGCENIDENQSFIFDVTGPNGYSKRVVINGNGSVTIKRLKIGTYTVTEVTNWSWRYTANNSSQSIELKPTMSNTVNFTNTRSNHKWLGGDAYSKNIFGN